jgi:hypothetical protein
MKANKKSWQDKRIEAINRKIKNFPYSKQIITEHYIEEHWRVCNSKASSKKEYKACLE